MDKIAELATIINNSSSVVFFGGAGVSTASGIPDFRSADGLYSKQGKVSPEEIISHSYFISHTKEFYEFYKKNFIYPFAHPNAVHKYLAKAEKLGKLSAVVTQNVDNLHYEAGSKNVLELHGNVRRNYCMNCGEFYDLDYIMEYNGIPKCKKCGGIVKPDVVLYEESLKDDIVEKSLYAILNAETLIIGGTSLTVYPATGFINYFKGKNLIVINKSPTVADNTASLVINDDINHVFSLLNEML